MRDDRDWPGGHGDSRGLVKNIWAASSGPWGPSEVKVTLRLGQRRDGGATQGVGTCSELERAGASPHYGKGRVDAEKRVTNMRIRTRRLALCGK